MLVVYDKKTGKNGFNNNGLSVLDKCMKAEITEELNGEYSLFVEYPADSEKANHLVEFNIIKVDSKLFRIYKVERQQDTIRTVKVWARHIFYDLAFYFIEAVNLVNANMKEAVEGTIPPEAQVSFQFSAPEKNIYPVKMRNVNALEGLFKLIDIYGGELLRNNYHVEIVEKRGRDVGLAVSYGKNIKGLKAIIDTTEFATRIYPIGDNNLVLPERYVETDSSIINLLPYPITRKVEFSGIKDVDKLRELAVEYVKKISNPFIHIKVDFLELSKTKEYEQYSKLFDVNLGDFVKVRHEKLGIYSELRVIKIVKDILEPINTKIELGQSLNTIINQLDFNSIVERLEGKIEGTQNAVIIKKNNDLLTISSSSYFQAMVVGISVLADTNLTCNLIIHCSASEDLVLNMRFALDGNYYDFQPSQQLARGENVVSLTIPILQVSAGQHAYVIELRTSSGQLVIDKNNLQIMIEGRHLEGGLSPTLPRAEVVQFVLYLLFMEKIRGYKEQIKEEISINHIHPTQIAASEVITYAEMANRQVTNMNTFLDIMMRVTGISQIADAKFYSNLLVDEWVQQFTELQPLGGGSWRVSKFVTINELQPITIGGPGVAMGSGVVFQVAFSNPNLYRELTSFEVTLVDT
ncbi:phage tail spike protein [Alkalihalobacterium bogoriense]|uniref:phage tail spike protein n=1 Tax=Alkalihalobacterium bogoriense TaxID=246272 RepID=UPI0006846766|nr:phage tail spike protein [Alkalihalobacterium bogoriense]